MAINYSTEDGVLVSKPAEGGSFANETPGELPTALNAANLAKIAQTAAELAETNAEASEVAAAASQAAASTSETNAAGSEASVASNAAIATTKAAEASASETNAASSAATATTQAGISTAQASTATTQAGIATTKATEASTSETNAAASETAAASSESAAASSESASAASETAAALSETNSGINETNAQTSATASASSAANSLSSANAASGSESNASNSATAAATSASTATAQASSATSSASAASLSATAAQVAETAAELAETNAEASELSASTDASTATTQAGISTTQAGISTAQAGNSATSATASATSATASAGSASTATTQAGIATTKATEASGSAATATTQAGIATTQASNAATSATASQVAETAAELAETNATTQASNAASSASAAAISATAAQVAETAAELAEVNAETAETAAELAETHAETAETNAEAAEAAALVSQTAATASQASATASAASASASASGASSSATDAQSSEDDAETSATAAAGSASASASSASASAASASNASTSATASANSATAAAASQASASTSASTATTKASEASTSATNAAASESGVATSATNAANSASASAASAATATTKASEASTSATGAAASLASFTGQYVSSATAPASPDLGDLWFDESVDMMQVYTSLGWANAGSAINGVENSVEYTATAGQTTFTATYDVGYLQVYLNGILLAATDYTATNGTSVVLDVGASLNDMVFIQAFGTFELADHYNKVDADARYLAKSGGTLTGDVAHGDNVRSKFGASDDLQIYHDGSNSFIKDTGVGNLSLLASTSINLINADSSKFMARFTDSGSNQFYYNGSEKLATTSTGVDVTGNISLPDNGKAKFGAGDDLQIYHDGTTSVIAETGTGDLRLQGSNIDFKSAAGETVAYFQADGASILYHNGSQKLATTATGVDVTGTLSADGLVSSGTVKIDASTPALWLAENDTTDVDGFIRNLAGDLLIQTINDAGSVVKNRISLDHATGDISFFEDQGITPKFFWDASAESLGIGTSSPSKKLEVAGDIQLDADNASIWLKSGVTGTSGKIKWTYNSDAAVYASAGIDYDTRATTGFNIYSGYPITIDASTNVDFRLNGAFQARLNSTGLGIGTSSPASALDVTGTVTADGLLVDGNSSLKGAVNIFPTAGSTEGGQIDFKDKDNASAWSQDVDGVGGMRIFTTNATARNLTIGHLAANTGAVRFYTNGAERLRITSGGNVGIGTSSPATALDVAGTVTADGLAVSGAGQQNITISGTSTNFILNETDTTDLNTRLRQTGGAFYIQTINDAGSAAPARLAVNHATGDISFYEPTGSTPKFLWDASAQETTITALNNTVTTYPLKIKNSAGSLTTGYGAYGMAMPAGSEYTMDINGDLIIDAVNVGIGTSSPDADLHVANNTQAGPELRLENQSTSTDSNTIYASINFEGNDNSAGANGIRGSIVGKSSNTNGGLNLLFSTATGGNVNTERMRIDPFGNVGIGTSSPVYPLVVSNSGAQGLEFIVGGTNFIQSYNRSTADYTPLKIHAETIAFGTDNGSERMRIDSSGNVIVGGTTAYDANATTILGNGLLYSRRTDSAALILRRDNSDGTMLSFDKSGNTVGSIGTAGGELTIGNKDAGLYFWGDSDKIIPWNTTTNGVSDGVIDLGRTTGRFKDLHLSGSAYVGTSRINNDLLLEAGTSSVRSKMAWAYHSSDTNSTYHHHKTSIPWAYGSQMFSVEIKGHEYGASKPISAQLCWYSYTAAGNPISIGTSGSHTMSLYQSSDGYLVIRIQFASGYYSAYTWNQYSTRQNLYNFTFTESAYTSTSGHYS